MHIINNDFSVNKPIYELNGTKYQFIGCRSIDRMVRTCIDKIKNLSTGKTKEISRIKLYESTRNIKTAI